ncbi:MAG: hypothetical protein GC181_03265 [Bacteroidetes bacterium]|nr:hypothetical protein [Bacteroidota bacterium]
MKILNSKKANVDVHPSLFVSLLSRSSALRITFTCSWHHVFPLFTLLLSSCSDEPKPTPVSIKSESSVLIINEGNFQRGNASLGRFTISDSKYTDQIFEKQNGFPIGDVFYEMKRIDGNYWCVVNNSGKIQVIDSSGFIVVQTIEGLTSPRRLAQTGNKVFVTDLYANAISVIDKNSFAVTGKIKIDGWTEHIISANGSLWVTNQQRPYLYKVDPDKEIITDSFRIANEANTILSVAGNKLLILCDGKLGSGEKSEVIEFDLMADSVVRRFTFAEGKPKFLRWHEVNQKLYFVQEGLWEFDPVLFEPVEKVLDLSGYIYGFNIRANGEFYFADARDFVENSRVSVFDKNFNAVVNFDAGINTSGFLFDEKP